MRKRTLTAVAVATALVLLPATAGATNRPLAEHYAKATAVAWAFDQHRQRPADVGYTRFPLGYMFDGCHRTGPGRFVCRVGIGVDWIRDGASAPDGPAVVFRAKVAVTFHHGKVRHRMTRRASDVALVTTERFITTIT